MLRMTIEYKVNNSEEEVLLEHVLEALIAHAACPWQLTINANPESPAPEEEPAPAPKEEPAPAPKEVRW